MPVRVFISYAHEDRAWCERLLDHLGGLRHGGQLAVFDDRQIKPGERWDDRIRAELAGAAIVVPLISPSFMGSRYCALDELVGALQARKRLVPVLVDHVDLEALPIVAIQCLPKDERQDLMPLVDWPNPNRALAAIAAAIRKAMAELGVDAGPTRQQPSVTLEGHEATAPGRADRGTTTMAAIYQAATPRPVDAVALARAEALLAAMSVDEVVPPASLPPGSYLPLRRNAVFVGRDPDLRALAATFKAGGTVAVGQSAAVTGLGGMGKTQLACEFAYRYGRFFEGGVFWLGCADPAAIPAEIAAGGRGLDLHPDFTGLPLEDQVSLVASAWHSELPRLLIFDNCEDEVVLESWVPRGGGCRVLVTTRRGTWRPELGVQAIALGILTRSESTALLHRHRPDLAEGDPVLDAIAAELGDLPLALHLAGSYLALGRHEAFGRPVAYLAALRQPDLLEHPSLRLEEGRSPTGHEQHVARTFALSWERLDPAQAADALARTILARAAWFAAGEPIPRELLRTSVGIEAEAAAAGFARGLARVHELGLATPAQQDGALVLHRLVAAFIRSSIDSEVSEAARAAVEQAVVTTAGEINRHGDPRPLLTWQPQLRAVAEAAERDGRPNAPWLLNQLGHHLLTVADLAGARAAFERALAINERVHGPDHRSVATTVNNLGGVLKDLGDLGGARAAFERALAIDERVHGPDHPSVAIRVDNLGSVMRAQGNLAGARAAHERALAISERVHGPDHPSVATTVNNLGLVLQDQGDLAGARAAFERTLAIDERVHHLDHPSVAATANNLGSVLWAQGDLAGAKAAFERALAIDERVHGPDHPKVAMRVTNLGDVLKDQGDLAGARAAFEQALAIFRRQLGEHHRHTEFARRSLATVATSTTTSSSIVDGP